MKENFTIIALGSNLGDRLSNLTKGFSLLKQNIDVVSASCIYASKAQLAASAPIEWDMEYYNCVFYGNTGLDSSELLELCKKVENNIGKREKGSWAPRKLDVDIIAYNNDVVFADNLVIPHPLMHERAFVTVPLAEILPEYTHPVLKLTAEQMASKCSMEGITRTKFKL